MPDTYSTERAYLGAALINPVALLEDPIEGADFHHYLHRDVHAAMLEMLDEFGKIDPLILSQRVNDLDMTDLLAMMGEVTSALNAGVYAKEIRKAAEKREVMQIASEMASDAAHGEVDPIKYADRLTRAIRVTGTTDALKEAGENYLKYVDMRQDNPSEVWGIPSPWSGFNKVTGGFQRKESVLFFGESGIGKTVLVLQAGFHAAMLGYKVDFYELEMSKENLMSRLVAMQTRIPTGLVNSGKLTGEQREAITEAVRFIEKLPIRISDETHWTSSEIRADQQKKRDRADMVIVDYLALLQDKADNAYERVETAAKSLRQMAKDLNQSVLTVGSQVKDGSIKGTAEVKYAQDMTWTITMSNDKNDPLRDLTPDKLRNVGEFKKVGLVFSDVNIRGVSYRLPMLEDFHYG